MVRVSLPLLVCAAALAASAGARADDEYEQKYRDGPCLVERKLEKNGKYKEVRECKGRPAWAAGGRREFDEQFRDGNCRIKRKLESDGDYKEEIECDERRESKRRGPPTRGVVYPPWVVVDERGGVAYPPGAEPAPSRRPGGRCNSETVGRILGGIAGAAIGSRAGSDDNRVLATLGGTAIGVLIGGEIGRRIDASDQACIGQALEFAPAGRRIEWQDPAGQRLAVVPGGVVARDGRTCRPFEAEVMTAQGWQKKPGFACRRPDGSWSAG